jgi:hypothetical protein
VLGRRNFFLLSKIHRRTLSSFSISGFLLAAINQLTTISSFSISGFFLPAINQLTTISNFTTSGFLLTRIDQLATISSVSTAGFLLPTINQLTTTSSFTTSSSCWLHSTNWPHCPPFQPQASSCLQSINHNTQLYYNFMLMLAAINQLSTLSSFSTSGFLLAAINQLTTKYPALQPQASWGLRSIS